MGLSTLWPASPMVFPVIYVVLLVGGGDARTHRRRRSKIDTVVVLMDDNESFDRVLAGSTSSTLR